MFLCYNITETAFTLKHCLITCFAMDIQYIKLCQHFGRIAVQNTASLIFVLDSTDPKHSYFTCVSVLISVWGNRKWEHFLVQVRITRLIHPTMMTRNNLNARRLRYASCRHRLFCHRWLFLHKGTLISWGPQAKLRPENTKKALIGQLFPLKRWEWINPNPYFPEPNSLWRVRLRSFCSFCVLEPIRNWTGTLSPNRFPVTCHTPTVCCLQNTQPPVTCHTLTVCLQQHSAPCNLPHTDSLLFTGTLSPL